MFVSCKCSWPIRLGTSSQSIGSRVKRFQWVLAVVMVVAGCSSGPDSTSTTVPSPASQLPTVSVSGASVQLQDGEPFVGMTVAASQPDVLIEVSGLDVGEVRLTFPTAQSTPSAPTKAVPVFIGGEAIDRVDVPDGQPVVFGPNGYGLFLPSLKAKDGEPVTLQLVFEDAGTVLVTAVVRQGPGTPPVAGSRRSSRVGLTVSYSMQ